MKKISFTVFACALSLFILFGLLPKGSATAFSDKKPFKKQFDLLFHTVSLIQNSYVQEVTPERLFHGAMGGLLKALDPYSQFLDAKAYEELQADTSGRFGGIGIEVSVKGGVLHVIAPLEGEPADEAGVRPQDVIQKIDNAVTKDMTLTDAVRKLRGEPGSFVALTLIRDEEPAPLELSIQRRVVKANGVREAKLLEPGVGYIRIAEFQERTPADLRKELAGLTAQHADGVILDLRNNPGGLLDSAVKATEQFIPSGEMIVLTRGRNSAKDREFRSSNAEPVRFGRIAVIVNRGSASGSEILAGALQDHGLARVIGKKTYGKGCVQTLTALPDGSAVRITTSFYYTPKGRLIHEKGITPDEEVTEDPKSGQDRALESALEWVRVKK